MELFRRIIFFELRTDDLAKPLASEDSKLSSMHNANREVADFFHRSAIVERVAVVGVFEKRLVVNDVA